MRTRTPVTAGGVEGAVEKIDPREPRIRDDRGRLHVIPDRAVEEGIRAVHREDEG
ncbi:MAG: hypothetical protein GXO72_06180 [Caldiserica bacterium]|nr:hypothetical protein [Caldisericota bacterium]